MTQYMEDNLDMPLHQVLPVIQDRIMKHTTYFGIPTLKSPVDFWVYQEIICETRPDVIIEIGNHCGGSTLALAHICRLLKKGNVVGIDVSHEEVPLHVKNNRRIHFIEGDACASFEAAKKFVRKGDNVLVIEDSAHTYDNTLNVLRHYSTLLRPGNYFIVEDGICHHGLSVGPDPGPYEAIETFTRENQDFEIDRNRENFLITWNPKGYLRRKGLPGNENHKHGDTSSGASSVIRSGIGRRAKACIPPALLGLIRRARPHK